MGARNWMRAAASCALGLQLALGAAVPALAEDAGAVVAEEAAVAEVEPEAEGLEAQAQNTVKLGETVKGTIADSGQTAPSPWSVGDAGAQLGTFDISVTKWGASTDGEKPYVRVQLMEGSLYAGGGSSASGQWQVTCSEQSPRAHFDSVRLDLGDNGAIIPLLHSNAPGTEFELTLRAATPRFHADAEGRATRYWGENALDTMQAVLRADSGFRSAIFYGDAMEGFNGGCRLVVLATADGYWDALAASGLAGQFAVQVGKVEKIWLEHMPVIITDGKELSAQARDEICRLAADGKVFAVGGPLALSDSVLDEVRALGCDVERIYGQNAADTATKIYEFGKEARKIVGSKAFTTGWSDTAIVATHTGYWDALSIAPYSWARQAPIFLTSGEKNELSDATLAAIKDGGFSRVVIVGGNLVVSSAVEGQLSGAGVGEVRRLAGQDAIATSAAIIRWEAQRGMNADHLAVATIDDYLDALCGAAVAGQSESVLALADKEGQKTAAVDAAQEACGSVGHAHILGGELALSADVQRMVLERTKG